jgi:ribonuclease Z
MVPFEITILGSSSALPTLQRYHTAHVLNVRERFFLIDCGEGTQIQMRRYQVKMSRINHIFISHLHGDHYFGLIGLLTSYLLLGRTNDLHIWAFSQLPEILKSQLEYMNEMPYKIIWHPLNAKKTQTLIEDDVLKIISFPLKHRIPCCGFLFIEAPYELNLRREQFEQYNIPISEIHKIKKGSDYVTTDHKIIPNQELTMPAMKPRSYVFCTDTKCLPELSELFNGVDVLYHEATFDRKNEKRANDTFHSTAEQAAMLAKASNVGQLVLGHFSTRYKDVSVLLKEALAIFENTVAAEDGMVVKVPQIRLNG